MLLIAREEIYESDTTVEELVDFIISKEMIQIGDPVNLGRLYKEIVSKDWFMALLDIREYIRRKKKCSQIMRIRPRGQRKRLSTSQRQGISPQIVQSLSTTEISGNYHKRKRT